MAAYGPAQSMWMLRFGIASGNCHAQIVVLASNMDEARAKMLALYKDDGLEDLSFGYATSLEDTREMEIKDNMDNDDGIFNKTKYRVPTPGNDTKVVETMTEVIQLGELWSIDADKGMYIAGLDG